jgi:uncharacterized protein
MKSLTLLIKPSSSKCNLNCKYCFYKDISNIREVFDYGFMSNDTLKNIVINALNEDVLSINFMFQGGEPTLIGIDFYKYLISLQKQFNNKQIKILNSIQTNGYDLSLDYIKFFKDNNFKYIQFILYLKIPKDDFNNNLMSSDDFYNFLNKLFNLWFKDLLYGNFISIKNFIDYINVLKGFTPTSCGIGGFCSIHTVIESNGDVYPCDFYCVDEWKLGNIKTNSFNELRFCEKAKSFFNRSLNISDDCKICKYFRLCGGGCKRNLEPFINDVPSYNYQCLPIKKFLNNNIDKLNYSSKIIE